MSSKLLEGRACALRDLFCRLQQIPHPFQREGADDQLAVAVLRNHVVVEVLDEQWVGYPYWILLDFFPLHKD